MEANAGREQRGQILHGEEPRKVNPTGEVISPFVILFLADPVAMI
jgi:hypothetical protein